MGLSPHFGIVMSTQFNCVRAHGNVDLIYELKIALGRLIPRSKWKFLFRSYPPLEALKIHRNFRSRENIVEKKNIYLGIWGCNRWKRRKFPILTIKIIVEREKGKKNREKIVRIPSKSRFIIAFV